ncbi:MAG TPA: metalloregulator ArsR/SmtB family transcription factor [Candidatus Binataceae bacterium]|nr:metalloregulator ArsR/SmtB family transcription factor [Candidatus Binataceae bacterium]
MDPATALLMLFKALADESRLKLIGLLAERERNVQELASRLKLKEPTVSHHLALLREAGLVQMRGDGNTHWYRLEFETIRNVSRSVLTREKLATLANDLDVDDWERKVLSNFLDGERIKDIPVARKKRWAILKWLATRLDPEASYTENQLNEVIKRHHWDTATIRREMIGYRMLARSKGIYRRLPEAEWQSEEKWASARE